MPWEIKSNVGKCKFAVCKKDGGEVVGCHPTREKAIAHLRALHANVKEAATRRVTKGK